MRTPLFQSVGFTFCIDINNIDILKVLHRSADKDEQRTRATLARSRELAEKKPVNSRENFDLASFARPGATSFYLWSILKPPGDTFVKTTFSKRQLFADRPSRVLMILAQVVNPFQVKRELLQKTKRANHKKKCTHFYTANRFQPCDRVKKNPMLNLSSTKQNANLHSVHKKLFVVVQL